MPDNPLGHPVPYALEYSPDLLFGVPRSAARNEIGIADPLPFSGVDIWNAWELSWLDEHGKPVVATAEIRVTAGSPNIIESKSLKLYLNSFAMTRYPDAETVADLIFDDLSQTAGTDIEIDLYAAQTWPDMYVSILPGSCIDDLDIECDSSTVDAGLLQTNDHSVTDCEVHSHLLRSNCPVTSQPDSGSVLIRYSGKHMDEAALLRYLVSYRQHNGFHEACIENIYVDIMTNCLPIELTVCGYYNRRGGLDINPLRSNVDTDMPHIRLWRQ